MAKTSESTLMTRSPLKWHLDMMLILKLPVEAQTDIRGSSHQKITQASMQDKAGATRQPPFRLPYQPEEFRQKSVLAQVWIKPTTMKPTQLTISLSVH